VRFSKSSGGIEAAIEYIAATMASNTSASRAVCRGRGFFIAEGPSAGARAMHAGLRFQ